jgi:hypothetical protein
MSDSSVGPISIVWMFLMVAGSWLLVNALVDIGGPSVVKWITARLQAIRHTIAMLLERAHDRVVEPRLR